MTQAEQIFHSFFDEGEILFWKVKAKIISTEIMLAHLQPMLERNTKEQLAPFLGFDIDKLPVSEVRTIDLKSDAWCSVNDKPCHVLVLNDSLSIEWGTGERDNVVNHRSTRSGPSNIEAIISGYVWGVPVPGIRLSYFGHGSRRPNPKKYEQHKDALEAQLLPIIEAWR